MSEAGSVEVKMGSISHSTATSTCVWFPIKAGVALLACASTAVAWATCPIERNCVIENRTFLGGGGDVLVSHDICTPPEYRLWEYNEALGVDGVTYQSFREDMTCVYAEPSTNPNYIFSAARCQTPRHPRENSYYVYSRGTPNRRGEVRGWIYKYDRSGNSWRYAGKAQISCKNWFGP